MTLFGSALNLGEKIKFILKGKERNFIPVSSRSSPGALIGDTVN